MKKLYRKLTADQKKRGVCYSSTLSNSTTEQKQDLVHEVFHSEFVENHQEAEKKIERLKDAQFFNGLYDYHIIRS